MFYQGTWLIVVPLSDMFDICWKMSKRENTCADKLKGMMVLLQLTYDYKSVDVEGSRLNPNFRENQV